MSSQRRRTFISGIFNYCDRWCDRCRFTEVCRLFYDEQRAMSRARRKGKDPDSFDTTLAMMDASFKRTTRLIKRWAKKEGIDLNEMVTPEVEAEVSRSRQSHAQTREHPLCQAANSYREAAHALLKRLSPLFDEARENAIERAQIMDVQGEAATLAKVRDAFDAIAWDHTMLMVKTHRAMNSLAEANQDPDDKQFHLDDAAGTATVARKCLLRSRAALHVLYDWDKDLSDDMIPLLVAVERIRRGLESEIPACLTYAWPPTDADDDLT